MRKNLQIRMMLLALGLSALAIPASATNVYLENFDSGTPLASDPLVNYGGIDPYWLDVGQINGIVAKCTGGGACYPSGNPITNDASGSGYFLFENTAGNNYDYTGGPGPDTFFASSSFSVSQNTNYTVSFALANATTCCFADIQAEINGSPVGPNVIVNGPSVNLGTGTAWGTVSFSWNSGSNIVASLDLLDLAPNGFGNDFGVDNISVASPVPEPSTLLMLGTGLLGLGGSLKRKLLS